MTTVTLVSGISLALPIGEKQSGMLAQNAAIVPLERSLLRFTEPELADPPFMERKLAARTVPSFDELVDILFKGTTYYGDYEIKHTPESLEMSRQLPVTSVSKQPRAASMASARKPDVPAAPPRQAGKWRRLAAPSSRRDAKRDTVIGESQGSAAQVASKLKAQALGPHSKGSEEPKVHVDEPETRRSTTNSGFKRKLKRIDDESLASTSQKRVLALDKEHTWDSTVRLTGGPPEVPAAWRVSAPAAQTEHSEDARRIIKALAERAEPVVVYRPREIPSTAKRSAASTSNAASPLPLPLYERVNDVPSGVQQNLLPGPSYDDAKRAADAARGRWRRDPANEDKRDEYYSLLNIKNRAYRYDVEGRLRWRKQFRDWRDAKLEENPDAVHAREKRNKESRKTRDYEAYSEGRQRTSAKYYAKKKKEREAKMLAQANEEDAG